MDLIGIKVLAGFILFAVAVVCGWTPYWCFMCCFRRRGLQRSGKRQSLFVQGLHSMASGVLISTCLLHLMPESLETVRDGMSTKEGRQNGRSLTSNTTLSNSTHVDMHSYVDGDAQISEGVYPLGELLIAFGFMCVFMVDSTIKSCIETKKRNSNIGNETIDDDTAFLLLGQTDLNQNVTVRQTETGSDLKESGQGNSRWFHWVRSKMSKSQIPYGPVEQREKAFDQENVDVDWETDLPNNSDIDARMVTNESESTIDVASPLSKTNVRPRISVQERLEQCKSNHLRSVALVAALCIHGFFDGLMLGLQTSKSVLISLMFAISLHKSFVAAGLSLNLLGTNTTGHSVIRIMSLVLAFATSSPLGVLVSSVFLHGTVGVASSDSTNIVPGCLQSFAVGTFMYVMFSETTERQGQRSLSADVITHVFLLVGFGVMAGLRAVVGDS